MQKLVISFSGGETSAFMALLLVREYSHLYDIKTVFANTGLENEETLEFVERCDKAFKLNVEWIEAVIQHEPNKGPLSKKVTFETASRNGEPFEEMIKKYGIPNMSFPHCSRVLKKQAIRHYCKGLGKYVTAIGIRADELDRISDQAEKERLWYPLAFDYPTTKIKINEFWGKMPFRLYLKDYEGNCKTCWKKSDRKLCTIALENPHAFNFMYNMENEYGNYRPESQPHRSLPARFFRGNKTVEDLFSLASSGNFTKAVDSNIPDYPFIDLDLNGGCGESCEAF